MLLERKGPITGSLLDVDYYKLTMLRLIFRYFREVPVEFSFANRTGKIRLANVIDERELREELEHARTLRFTDEELSFLSADPNLNDPVFIDFLRNFRLPPILIQKNRDHGTYRINVKGSWEEVSFWETIVMHTINELRSEALLGRMTIVEREGIYNEGDRRLTRKINLLKKHPEIQFFEFGTRRRWGRRWQRHCLDRFAEELPQSFLGTSNVRYALDLGLKTGGTLAHELFMGVFGIRFDKNDPGCVERSHREVLEKWLELYGDVCPTALTDTYGTDFFLQTLTDELAHRFQAFRLDSGSPYTVGDKLICDLISRGIDPREKMLIFSDGLTVKKMVAIHEYFQGRIKLSFGWGTNATNDLNFLPASLVMKLTRASGNSTVKLSDNIAKAVGPIELVEWIRGVCGYRGVYYERPVY